MNNSFSSDVRVWNDSINIPIGVGFVVSPNHVITCAHVVADALGDRQLAYGQYQPEWNIRIDFPSIASGKIYTAKIRGWAPLDGPAPDDMAILELNQSIPEEVKPISVCEQYISGDLVRAFGVRENLPRGTYVEGKYQGQVAGSRLCISSENKDNAINPGCSGGAVWLANGKGVIGMTTSKILEQNGYALPIEEISKFFKAKTGLDILNNDSDWYVDDLIAKMFDVELSDQDRLKVVKTIPMGPGFDPFDIPYKIKESYAASGGDNADLANIIGKANETLLGSLPEKPKNITPFILQPFKLGNPAVVGLLNYWTSVFHSACGLSPRLVGSLLVVTPPPILIGIKDEVLILLRKLRRIK